MPPANERAAKRPGDGPPVPSPAPDLAAALEAGDARAAAIAYAHLGAGVFPVNVDGAPEGCEPKQPRYAAGLRHPFWTRGGARWGVTSDPVQVARHWPTEPGVAVGLVWPGVVLDIDAPKHPNLGPAEREAKARERYETLCDTFEAVACAPYASTPSGGYHVVLAWPEGVEPLNTGAWPPGSDPKAPDVDDRPWGELRGFGRAYVVAAPGTIDGEPYRWHRLPLGEVPEAPPELIAWLTETAEPEAKQEHAPRDSRTAAEKLAAWATELGAMPEGGRNAALNRFAFMGYQRAEAGELEHDAVTADLLDAAERAGLPTREAKATLASARKGAKANPRKPRPAPAKGRTTDVARSPTPDGGDAETGAPLYLPAGYGRGDGGELTYTEPNSNRARVVYAGHLEVIATGRTLEGDERLTVAFDLGHERRTVTAPRGELVRARGVLDHLGAAGANVHDGNARDVGRYLSEYSALNADALPRQRLSERLGITPGGIIGPGWQVGEHVTYTGPELHALTIRTDRDAYRTGLRALGTWEPSAWLARAVLGLVAAAPHLEHLGMTRNPVLGIGAPSNIGKGTAVGFAFGLYAEPGHPFMVSGIRTRTTALLQVYAQTNGLPVWIDEAHQLPPAVVTDGVYSFANRQTYARGGREGIAKGGDRLRGALILTGEGLAELMTTGARNRVLIVDGLRHYPLGREAAPDRAVALERATALGAGSVGQAVTAHLWEHRATWTRDVHQLADRLTTDAPTWHVAAAAAEVTIRYMLDALDLPADRGAEGLALHMLAAVTEGWREVDPARDAFERVRDLVIAARSFDGTRRARDGGALARIVTTDGMAGWAVRATAPEVEDVLKPYGGARVVAPLWQRRGYVRPDPHGKSTRAAKLEPGEPAVRCYVFALEHFEGADEAERTAAAARLDLEGRAN